MFTRLIHATLSRDGCQTRLLPVAIVMLAIGAMLLHGPIGQLANYHQFADQRQWLGLPHIGDVLSNLGFALVGIFGLSQVWRQRGRLDAPGWTGYALFFMALLLTALGSSWYHLAPDNDRLVWDRLPIALACAGLLAAVGRETLGGRWLTPALVGYALLSVAWWYYTEQQGRGDLRPYLLLQVLPLVLIPLLQWQYRAPRAERLAYMLAIVCYVLAKLCELGDHAIFSSLTVFSGHTLKHLFATLAAAVLAWHYAGRHTADDGYALR